MANQMVVARLVIISAITALVLAACGGGGGGGGRDLRGPASDLWLIDRTLVVDGGPGRDGIPALDSPQFQAIVNNTDVLDDDLVIAVRFGNETKVYPHDIMDYHEIVNDDNGGEAFLLSYCPLTGSAVSWEVDQTLSNKTFGVSGLLYNSNLLLFDRQTESLWQQMLQMSINGERVRELPLPIQVVETTKATIRDMYPDAQIMTRNTGHLRNYDVFLYGSYRTNSSLLFPVQNIDTRLHPKTRVLGIRQASDARVFQLHAFAATTEVIQDQIGGVDMVIVGNSVRNFAVAFDRLMEDGTILNFAAIDDPANPSHVLQDDEGNIWNAFGIALSGPRAGESLKPTNSYISYWFAFVAFFPQAEIHFN